MRLGQVPVAQPVVHVGELVLDRRLDGPVAIAAASDGRGGLELGQRLPVPAEHDQHLAQGDPPGQLRVARAPGPGSGAHAPRRARTARGPPRRPATTTARPRRPGRPAAGGRRWSRPGWWPDRARAGGSGCRPPGRAAAGAGPGWPIRRRSGAAPRRESRTTAPAPAAAGGGISVSRDRASASSSASTISSSPRPLTARSRSASLSLPSTAAAVSICLAGSLTACSRLRSRSLTLAGGHQSACPAPGPRRPARPSADRSASTYSRTSMGSPRVSASSRATSIRGIPSRPSSAPIASGPSGPGSIALAHGLVLGLAERGPQHPQPLACFGLPAQHQQQRPVGEPADQVGEQAERRAVRPVHVLHHHDAAGPRRRRLPAARAASSVAAMAAYSRVSATGLDSGGAGTSGCAAASAGTSRPAIAASAAAAGRAGRAGPRARCAAGRRPARTAARSRRRGSGPPARRRPPPAASARNSLISRVLPQPAWPATATTRPLPPGRLPGRAQRPPAPRPGRPAATPRAAGGSRPSGPEPGRAVDGGRRDRRRPGARSRWPAAVAGRAAAQPPGPHVVVQPGGLGQRADGQLAAEHPDQRTVLAHGRRPLAGPAVQPDDRLVSGLVQRVELQPAPGVPGGALELAVGDAGGDQPLQPAGELLPQLLGHRRLPVLEVRAAAQGEPGQEVVPVQLRPRAPARRRPAGLSGRRSRHVHPDPPARARRRPADDQPSPIAAAVTDRVRRSDARALARSASGHSRSARRSRLCSRPVTASSASRATAFLVSNVTGAPSRPRPAARAGPG